MLFNCYECGELTFEHPCPRCGSELSDQTVPLDPRFYPEFAYTSQGFWKDLFVKKKSEQKLNEKLDRVLSKYGEFEKPYFVNFVHITDSDGSAINDPTASDKMKLFHAVLVRLGFDELSEEPQLTRKLVRSTAFRFLFDDFTRRIGRHESQTLDGILRSWIEESGTAFRRDLHLLVYHLASSGRFEQELGFNLESLPIVGRETMRRFDERCEEIYFDVLVDRFKSTLESFDPTSFVTIYTVDAMDGYQFEDFLAMMYTSLGYEVEVTKKGADQGADLFAERFGQKLVIQAKNYTDSVGNSAVQQVLAAKAFYGCDDAMVVTNSHFTPSAKQLAEQTRVRLVDRTELKNTLDDYNRQLMEAAVERTREDGARGDAV